MTVQELIDELAKCSDKNKRVIYVDDCLAIEVTEVTERDDVDHIQIS